VNDIIGDSYIGNGSGNDTIINYGVVMNIYGDSFDRAGSGNDTIINNGSVSGDIIAGGGNDYIVIRGSVGGLIDGGDGIDILDFGLAGCAGVLQGDIIGEVIASADENPAGGTITIGANTYTWANFEELLAIVEIFFCDGRNEIHDFATPTVSYCNSLGGFDVYDVNV